MTHAAKPVSITTDVKNSTWRRAERRSGERAMTCSSLMVFSGGYTRTAPLGRRQKAPRLGGF